MARWLEIVLTLVLFAAAMTAVGWVVNATVPPFGDWVWDRIGGTAAWAALILVWLAAGAYAWHGHREPGTSANGR